MFISRSNNFVFIRIPKTGSTSALFYFLNSGLYDSSTDTVALDGKFYSWQQMQKCFVDHPKDYLEKARQVPFMDLVGINREVHSSYSELVKKEKIDKRMPCYSVVRNPINRLCSIYFYKNKQREVVGKDPKIEDVNEFCYKACIKGEKLDPEHSSNLQSSYFPENAKLWNIENIHEHAVADITSMGGTVGAPIHVRKTSSEQQDYKALLSHEVIQMMELKYAHDFDLWEKAYAVYN